MNLPPFPDEYIPTSPEARRRLIAWGEECARQAAIDAARVCHEKDKPAEAGLSGESFQTPVSCRSEDSIIAADEADHKAATSADDDGQSDAAKMLENAIQKGHRFVLCIETQDRMSTARMSNVLDAKDLARMLGRFHRSATEDAKWPGDDPESEA